MRCPFGSEDWVCNGEDELCFTCADIYHSILHPIPDDDCRECRLASVQLSPSCRGQARNNVAPRGTSGANAWERGIATDHRGIPYRDFHTGSTIPLKKFADHRSKYEESLRANKALQQTGS